MINWLAVIGVAACLIAISLMVPAVLIAVVAWKSYGKIKALSNSLDKMILKAEHRVDELDALLKTVQEEAESAFVSVVSRLKGMVAGVAEAVSEIRQGLHVAHEKDEEVEEVLDEEEEDIHASYGRESDGRPGNPADGTDPRPDGIGPRVRPRWRGW